MTELQHPGVRGEVRQRGLCFDISSERGLDRGGSGGLRLGESLRHRYGA